MTNIVLRAQQLRQNHLQNFFTAFAEIFILWMKLVVMAMPQIQLHAQVCITGL